MEQLWRLPASQKQTRIFPDLELAIEQILKNRGINSQEKKQEFLFSDYSQGLHDPFLLSDMKKAVQCLLQARKNQEKVCIFGDYDADGVTASALLTEFFNQINIKNFCYIPDKTKEGYGINNVALDYIKEQGAKLIVTVDCGISSKEEAQHAKELGLDLIITDHHHVPPQMPECIAIINPKKQGDQYPEKMLAGVGVAFKLVQALAQKVGNYDQEQIKWLLDLVAIGTIADCVPLQGENRTLTKFGLMVLAKTKRTGLKQLFHVGKININENSLPTSQQVSFQIAPRINAAGRMDHANTAFKLLISKENQEPQARVLALEIEEKNTYRQKITDQVVRDTENQIKKDKILPPFILQTHPHWEFGVIGLAAGRIAEKFSRPTILLKEENGFLRGSGRSIPSFNLIETLERHKDLLAKYGGHSQACGLEVTKEKLPLLHKALFQKANQLSPEDFTKEIKINAELKPNEISQKLLQELNQLEPFGQENPSPIFYTQNITVQSLRYIGKDNKHLKLLLGQNGLEALIFNFAKKAIPEPQAGNLIDIVYNLEENEWNGNKKPQALVIDLRIK